jgi:uncharacterized protein (TIGR03437 family)
VFELGTARAGVSPGLSAYSGNGQITSEYQLTASPLVVRATDTTGVPLANTPVSWTIAGGQGNLVAPITRTDSNGFAMTDFMATAVPGGRSFAVQTVTASSPAGTATFTVTTLANGATPVVQLLAPANPATIVGANGSTLSGALKVALSVAGGPQDGTPLSSASVGLVDANNPAAAAAVVCAGAPGGVAVTDATGNAACDLMLSGPPGSYSLALLAGGQPATVAFSATITPAITCSYAVSQSATHYGAAGGSGSVYVSAGSACPWNAVATLGWLSITSDGDGAGSGWLCYTVAANNGPARTGTITISDLTVTITQDATGGSSPLAIATAGPLSDGSTAMAYSTTLAASGGAPPYSWSVAGPLPPGLTLNAATGTISGPPLVSGTSSFQITVADSAGATATMPFSITIEGFGGGIPGSFPALKNTVLPAGVAGVAYLQTLTVIGGCTGPLDSDPAFSITTGALPAGIAIREISPRLYAIAGVPGAAGAFTFTISITDGCGRTGSSSLSMSVGTAVATAVPIFVSPGNVQFTVRQSDTASPPDQPVAMTSSTSFSYLVSLIPGTGGNWLSAAGPVSGSPPATIVLHAANYSTLPAGTYTGGIAITPSSGGPPLLVPVTLQVLPSAALTVSPAAVTLTVGANAGAGSTGAQTISVQAPQTATYSVNFTVQSGGNWLSVSKTTGTSGDTFDINANAGSLPPGTYNGTVTVTPTAPTGPTQTILVTLVVVTAGEVMPTPGMLTLVYRAGDPVPAPVSISLQTLGGTAPFTASADSAWVTVTPGSSSAPGTLSVAVDPTTLTAGAHYASLIISTPGAAGSRMSVPVTLFIPTPPPVITSVQNAASFASGAVAPGEAVAIFGSYVGPPFLVMGTETNSVQSTQVGSVQVSFNGIAAPILYARQDVVSAMVPFGITPGKSIPLQVTVAGLSSAPFTVSTAAAAPGIFVGAGGQAIAVNADGSANGPGSGASPGDVVGIYLTGGGATTPASKNGQIATDTSAVLAQPVVAQVNGIGTTVVSAGNAPGFPAGISLLQIQLPGNLPRGAAASLTITIGGVAAQSGVTIYIAP